MVTAAEQHYRLDRVAKLVGPFECNCGMSVAGADVASLQAVDTPDASQIVYASGTGYDVWTGRGNQLKLQKTELSAEDAAVVIIIEYLTAKAARVKAHKPHMEVSEIMRRLINGYQNTGPRSPVVAAKLKDIIG